MYQEGRVVADVATGMVSISSLLDRLGLEDEEDRATVIRFFEERELGTIGADLAQQIVTTVADIDIGQTSRDLFVLALAAQLNIPALPELEHVVGLLTSGHPPADGTAV